MLVQKPPVQRGEWAGLVTSFLSRVVFATGAVVAHAFDVSTRGNVGLAGEAPAICKQGHAGHIGQLNPFNRIHIHRQKPVFYLLWNEACEQGEIADHHEALNVMRITIIQRLTDGVFQTVHVGIAGPKPFGQIKFGLQMIVFAHLRHVEPIHPAHEFTPAQNLANKPFCTGYIHLARAVRGFGFFNHLERMEQMQIDCARNQ